MTGTLSCIRAGRDGSGREPWCAAAGGAGPCYGRAEIVDLSAEPPGWLIAACEHREAQRERDRACRERRAAREADELVVEAYLRAMKDCGDTDGWAAGALHSARIHWIDLGDGKVAPVLPPALRVVG